MQEVDFASLKAREAAPDPTSSACGADMELYMRDCRRLLELGLKRWGGDAPERLGPRVLNPDDSHDRELIERLYAPHPEGDGTATGSPPRLEAPARAEQPPAPQLPAPQPPAPQGSAAGEAPEAAARGEAAGAAEPMEVEPPPAPAPTQAPTPLLVPPSALPSLGLSQLVQELEGVVGAVPLDESRADRLLDSLEGLKLTEQEMQDSGAPPPAAHLHHPPACPNAMAPAALPPNPHRLTAPHRRVQAGQQAVRAVQEDRRVCGAPSAR